MKALTFQLCGPLSSFGECSRWDHRDTADMPTKSAVIGLLGCCMGIPRGDGRLCELDDALCMGIRRESCGNILTDYQTVTGPNGVILNAQGKNRGSTITTPKQYLQDAVFQVFLTGSEDVLERCAEAMRHPQWVICLGRRGLVPSRPVIPHIIEAESLEDAVRNWQEPGTPKDKAEDAKERVMRCEVEVAGLFEPNAAYTVIKRNDRILNADVNNYAEREVCVFTVRRDAVCT